MDGITNIPEKLKHLPKRKCTCQSTKVNGKCFLRELCMEEAVVYRGRWKTTDAEYIDKTHEMIQKRSHDHYHGLNPYVNSRDQARKQLKLQQMLNENPEENPRPTKKRKSKTTSEPTPTPCVVPLDTPSHPKHWSYLKHPTRTESHILHN